MLDWSYEERLAIQTKCPEIAPVIYPVEWQVKGDGYQKVKRRRLDGTLIGQMGCYPCGNVHPQTHKRFSKWSYVIAMLKKKTWKGQHGLDLRIIT